MDFIEYLTKIAPEGETILFVKQKPSPVLLNDGSPKYTWPAYLPSKWRAKPPAAWYCNTGCFIIDRFIDGKPSAGASYCDRVAFLVLDDVGTKSKTPTLEPTWIIETSEDNYQWGYTFALDEQPLKNEFSAAIKAIAAAGYTDPGAINPVRNFRIPNSINLKPGRNNFAANLIEFHPEREFSLTQICQAFGVVPHEVETATRAKINLVDSGSDDVLAWLNATGQIMEPANAEGWVGVVCPNNAEHTNGDILGRYHPVNRAFCCFHGHCTDLDSRSYLDWIADNGGPKHTYGLRDDLLAQRLEGALSKLTPTETFPDDAAAIIAEVERKELGRVEKAQWYERFAYVQNDENYFDLQDRREISRSTFNALYRHIDCKSIHTSRKIEASVCYDENRFAKGARVLVGITYSAGDGVLVTRDGDVYGNRWRDARPQINTTATDAEIKPWLDHCAVLVPEHSEREHLFNIMAFKTQHPEIKINHAVLHGGDEGCGKDTFWAPFIWAVCGPDLKNRGLVDNDSITSSFGYHLESEILIINELKEPDARERRALANKLKPLIAAPPEMLTVNRKGLHPYDMVNRMFVLAFSNDPVPISIPTQDRRWFCVWSHAPRMAAEDAQEMWTWYHNGGFEKIAAWLYARDVSAFNPAAAPAMTEFKYNLIEHGMSMGESYLVELIRNRIGEFSKGVVGSPFHALCDRLTGGAPTGVKLPQAALLHALKEAGWKDAGRLSSRDFPTRKHIFCAPDMIKRPKTELRNLVENIPPPNLVVVK